MKTGIKVSFAWVSVPLVMALSACQFSGEPLLKDGEETFHFGGDVVDNAPLSARVRQALRNNPETATLRIDVSEVSEDSVKLSGFVSNDTLRHQVERVAGQVEGVRFVVNALFIN